MKEGVNKYPNSFDIIYGFLKIWWTTEVGIAFTKLEEGYENAIKDYYKKQIAQLNNLIVLLLGSLKLGIT